MWRDTSGSNQRAPLQPRAVGCFVRCWYEFCERGPMVLSRAVDTEQFCLGWKNKLDVRSSIWGSTPLPSGSVVESVRSNLGLWQATYTHGYLPLIIL